MKNFLLITVSLAILCGCSKREVREIKDPYSGQIIEQIQIVETKEGSFLRDGFYKTWYKNGQIEISGNYSKNKKSGKWTEYYSNGQIKLINVYNEDKVNGIVTEFYENGNKKTEGLFVMSKATGVWKTWYENSQISNIENYENDFLHGTSESFYSNGQKESIINYFKGVKEGTATYWHSNGQKKSEGKYSNNKKLSNEWNYWDENGEESLNKSDIIIGKWHNGDSTREFTPDGNCKVVMDKDGSIINIGYSINNNELILRALFSSESYPFLTFEQNSFSIKDNDGKIWYYKRID